MGSGLLAMERAVQLHRAGELGEAGALYEQVLRDRPQHASAWHLLGVVHLQTGNPSQAVAYIERAIALDGSQAVFFGNLGVALRALGRLDEALAAQQHVLTLNPAFADAWANAGLVLQELGNPDEATSALNRAIELAPEHVDALFSLANLRAEQDSPAASIRLYRRAAEVAPRRADILNNLGNALLAAGKPVEAIDCYRQAGALESDRAESYLNLGAALAGEERIEEAREAFCIAARLRPDRSLWKIREVSLCPTIFESVDELDRYRAQLNSRLDAYLAEPAKKAAFGELLTDAFVPSFNLAHHGCDNRRLMEKFVALFAPHIPRYEPHVAGGRPRIGFLVTRPHEGGFVRTMAGIVRHLDRRRFQPVVLCPAGAISACREAIARDDVEWIALPGRYAEAVDRIRQATCHLLYYRKATADPLAYLLAMTRLAPVQCTSWGTHLTSGIAEMDYYVSSGLIEADDADSQYTERLVRLGSIPSFEEAPAAFDRRSRSDFGLPERGHLYLCPQRLAKFHPAHDPLLRQVLQTDGEGYLVLIRPERREPLIEKLLRRFERTLGAAARRVVLVPPQKPEAFRALLAAGDVLLDLPHYGVSLMAYDALAVNLPLVTLPGRLKVERYGLAFARKMGMTEMIASSAEEYVALAVRIATDRDYREHLRREIAERKQVLFEDMSVVREHEQFFEESLAR